jgi:hypothetical protein
MLEVSSPEAPHREWKPKIPQGEGGSSCQNALKDLIEVNIGATNGDHRALGEVGTKAGNHPETFKDES